MKKGLLILTVMLSALCLHANGTQEGQAAGEDTDKIKVGLSVFELANPYFVQIANGATERAEELGIELVVSDPKLDVAKQVASVENFIAMGCDAIIISALDPEALSSVLEEAQDQDIKIIAQSMKTKVYDVFASAEEWDMGHTIGVGAGKWIRDNLGGEAEVALLTWNKIPQMITRGQGIEDGILEYAPNAKIVARQDATNPEGGLRVTENILQANPNVKVIAAVNDSGAIGALSAVEGAGMDSDDFFIGGVDATPEAIDKIKANTAFRATVDIIPFENGRMIVDFAYDLVMGEDVERDFVVPTKLVNAENISEY